MGYNELECEAYITRFRKVKTKNKEEYHIVLNQSPFYAESGGQVGDTGELSRSNESIKVLNTYKENGVIIQVIEELPYDIIGRFTAKVDASKRTLTENNHSATHLLHAALRSILGTHVEQKGSFC